MTVEQAIQKLIDIARAQEGNNELELVDPDGIDVRDIRVITYDAGNKAVEIDLDFAA